MTDYGLLEQVKAGEYRNEPLGVHVCPTGKKSYARVKPDYRVKAYGVPVTNAEELCPVGSIACYHTKGGKGVLIPCKVEEYRHDNGKAVISIENGRSVRVVSQDFIRPLSLLTRN
jgi:hypothetical protein